MDSLGAIEETPYLRLNPLADDDLVQELPFFSLSAR